MDPEGLPRVLSRPTLALLVSGFLWAHSEGGQLNSPPPPGRAAFQPPAWYALEVRWNPQGVTTRIIAPQFCATGDGFLVWGSFPHLVHTETKVDPEGLPRVLSRLALALVISWLFPLGSFGRWEAQSAPTPRTSNISAARLVRTGYKV